MGCGVVTRIVEHLGEPTDVLVDVSKDYAGAGVGVKYIPLEKGQLVVQHRHKYPHLSILLSGTVIVSTDGWSKTLVGPDSIVIAADEYHAVEALTDAVWLCVHNTEDLSKEALVND